MYGDVWIGDSVERAPSSKAHYCDAPVSVSQVLGRMFVVGPWRGSESARGAGGQGVTVCTQGRVGGSWLGMGVCIFALRRSFWVFSEEKCCVSSSLSTKLSVVVLILESKVQREAVGIVFNFTAVGRENIVFWQ